MTRATNRGPNARPAFMLLLSKEERAELQAKADRARLPLGTWIRYTCLHADEPKTLARAARKGER